MPTFDYAKINLMIQDFVTKREWDQFHSPKNLSMALSVEASELLEIFQWMGEEESKSLDESKMKHVEQELADITYYVLLMASKLNVNLEKAMIEKMALNESKYPANKSQGSSKKYDEY